MKRLLASVLLVWYAVLSMGFYLHVHYCCGEVAEIAINQAVEKCEGSCSSHAEHHPEKGSSCCMAPKKAEQNTPSACTFEKSCCSSDEFYVALEELHTKTDVELSFAVAPVEWKQALPEFCEEGLLATTYLDGHPATGPPLYIYFQQSLHYL